MESYQNIIEVIQKYIPLQITFLLADRGISITDPNYSLDSIDWDITKMKAIFEEEIKIEYQKIYK